MTRKKPKGAHVSEAVPETVHDAGANANQAAGSSTRNSNSIPNRTLASVNGSAAPPPPPPPTLVICRNKYTALLPIEVQPSGLDLLPGITLLTSAPDIGAIFPRTMALG